MNKIALVDYSAFDYCMIHIKWRRLVHSLCYTLIRSEKLAQHASPAAGNGSLLPSHFIPLHFFLSSSNGERKKDSYVMNNKSDLYLPFDEFCLALIEYMFAFDWALDIECLKIQLMCFLVTSIFLYACESRPSQQTSKEEYKLWKWGAMARYYASHTKTMLPTRKSVPRSSRQSDHTKTS